MGNVLGSSFTSWVSYFLENKCCESPCERSYIEKFAFLFLNPLSHLSARGSVSVEAWWEYYPALMRQHGPQSHCNILFWCLKTCSRLWIIGVPSKHIQAFVISSVLLLVLYTFLRCHLKNSKQAVICLLLKSGHHQACEHQGLIDGSCWGADSPVSPEDISSSVRATVLDAPSALAHLYDQVPSCLVPHWVFTRDTSNASVADCLLLPFFDWPNVAIGMHPSDEVFIANAGFVSEVSGGCSCETGSHIRVYDVFIFSLEYSTPCAVLYWYSKPIGTSYLCV